MLNELGQMDELFLTKDNQRELKNTITEIKNTLGGVNSRLDDIEEQNSELKDRVGGIIQVNRKKNI